MWTWSYCVESSYTGSVGFAKEVPSNKYLKSTRPPGEQRSKAEDKSREGQTTEGKAGGEYKEDN